MRIDVAWTTAELEHFNVQERAPVVVDVLRAASSIATAIHNGARALLPAESIEGALRIANSIGRRDVVLCGERDGEPIEGFDLGNSPSEFTRQAVGERTLVMTTTNGTRALAAVAGPGPAFVAGNETARSGRPEPRNRVGRRGHSRSRPRRAALTGRHGFLDAHGGGSRTRGHRGG
jgi:2-phosphosulfolactate phosphatase